MPSRRARAGTYSNLVRQAKSKQKILDKMEAAGLTKPVRRERTFVFTFPECDKLPPPVLPFVDVSFAYSGKEEDMLYRVGGPRMRAHGDLHTAFNLTYYLASHRKAHPA